MKAVDAGRLTPVRDLVRAFADDAPGVELSALDLYLALEAATPLLGFHTMARRGPRNRQRNGLQQTYGDHNRLLALGLDRLVAGDVDWLLGRADPADPPSRDSLEEACRHVAALDIDRETAVALWLAAAFHDVGMLVDADTGLDVEHAGELALPFVEELGFGDRWLLVSFVIRHHDYVRDVYSGEVPAAVIEADLEPLDVPERHVALTALGMVQIAGSASLGEGRLSAHRVGIMLRCATGAVLDDVDAAGRVARLVEGRALDIDEASRRRAALWTTGAGYVGGDFWNRVLLHGWGHVRAAAADEGDDRTLDPAGLFSDDAWSPRLANALGVVAHLWYEDMSAGEEAHAPIGADHVVITPGAARALVTGLGAEVTTARSMLGAGRGVALRVEAPKLQAPD